ncbi:MAG: hypothetical protein Q9222_002065 [Ikaeria aurantiellina]
MDSPHFATQDWTQGVPSPPRVVIPPPPVDQHGVPDLQINDLHKVDSGSCGFDNTEFLKTVTYNNFWTQQALHDWEYKQRRTAQQILPFLFLGPITAARDPRFLQDNGITMLLAVRDTKIAHSRLLDSKVALELGIPCATVDTAGNQELIAAFPRGTEIINAHLSDLYRQNQMSSAVSGSSMQGKVLVFCETGNDRSAAMVVAYLMGMYPMDLVKAIQVVTAHRFSAALNDSMKVLLQTYASILQAKRDVMRSQQQISATSMENNVASSHSMHHSGRLGKSNKRTLDNDNDEDMANEKDEMMMDGGRFEKREGAAPFSDPLDFS